MQTQYLIALIVVVLGVCVFLLVRPGVGGDTGINRHKEDGPTQGEDSNGHK